MPGPIHRWFGLSYDSYVVLPRVALQSMPDEWQERFIAMFAELNEAVGHHGHGMSYVITTEDPAGRTVPDPLADYERGRRRLEARKTPED